MAAASRWVVGARRGVSYVQGLDESPGRVERFNAAKVWRNVYGLGIGTFCMSYCMQMPSRQCNTFLCSTMWLISVQDFFFGWRSPRDDCCEESEEQTASLPDDHRARHGGGIGRRGAGPGGPRSAAASSPSRSPSPSPSPPRAHSNGRRKSLAVWLSGRGGGGGNKNPGSRRRYAAGASASRDNRRRVLSYYHGAARADCHNYVLMPGMIGLYGVIATLMFANMPVPHSVEFAFINIVIPIVGPIAMQYIRKPMVNVSETIELGSPVAALLSMCVICTFLSSQTGCVSHRFVAQSSPPGGDPLFSGGGGGGGVADPAADPSSPPQEEAASTITSMVLSGIMNSSHPVKVYPLPVISTLLGPIAGVCSFVAITTSYANGRSFDVAVVFLVISIAVEAWIHLFHDDAGRAGPNSAPEDHSAIDFIQNPGSIKHGIFMAEIILTSLVALGLVAYRCRDSSHEVMSDEEDEDEDYGDAALKAPSSDQWDDDDDEEEGRIGGSSSGNYYCGRGEKVPRRQ